MRAWRKSTSPSNFLSSCSLSPRTTPVVRGDFLCLFAFYVNMYYNIYNRNLDSVHIKKGDQHGRNVACGFVRTEEHKWENEVHYALQKQAAPRGCIHFFWGCNEPAALRPNHGWRARAIQKRIAIPSQSEQIVHFAFGQHYRRLPYRPHGRW